MKSLVVQSYNHTERLIVFTSLKAQGLLDDIVPPGQTGVGEIEFADGTVRCEITNDDGPDK